ncbi:MAG: hypothetical protein WBW87_07615, partial [Candidatus Cybelea sp.]
MRARFAVIALALAVLPALAGGTTIEQRIANERAKAAQIQARLHAKRAELHAVTMHYNDLQQQLGETNVAIGQVSGRIDSLQTQRDSTQRRIDWTSVQLGAAQRSLRLHDEMLKRRLVDVYEFGDLTYFNALIGTRSFSEFVERWEDLRLLIAANQRTVRSRKAAEERVAAIEADLERTRLALQQEEAAQQEARSQLDSLAGERRNLVELTAVRRHGVESEVAQMESLSAAEESALEGLIL